MASIKYGDNAQRYRDNTWAGSTMYNFLYVRLQKFIHQTLSLFGHLDTIFYPQKFHWKKSAFGNSAQMQLFICNKPFEYQTTI
jgi:hypothetical protein